MQAELQSRVEMYDAQVEKLQLAVARADDEKARLEEQLQAALATASPGSSAVSPTPATSPLRVRA